MTVALWCILIAGLLPYGFTIAAKTGRGFSNRAPRAYLEKVEGWRQRAHWAQLNSFEGLPLFVGAVLTCHIVAGEQYVANIIALVYVVARALYGLMYVIDRPLLRSLMWFVAMLANAGLFLTAAAALS
jgi:uncharacterized MAPEG superfamily protein